MPIIFNLHQLALFHMPNSAYYPTLAGKPSAVFYPEVYYGMTYTGLEFLTMVMAIKVLKRILRFSPLCQLAFVLEKQADTIQIRLIGAFVYIMQISLKHIGADFSFKFSWLHSPKTAS
ncbi:hypothetical protein PF008_g494 [Phytophthora fragariae]|uniref:Uncharacterized protein n=1 Tax=Phytophthora fragariae TaxID=53985 RepID=A0A6G0SMX3_9STRA|nr:hypothetical protein PF008_g494 [Phytophthora fragariae]